MPRSSGKKDNAAAERKSFGWRGWLRVTVWTVAFAGMAWGGVEVRSFLRSDARFSLDCDPDLPSCVSLEIHGAKYASVPRLRSIFAKDFNSSIFKIPLDQRRRSLLSVDWVASAAVSRIWPNRIVVTVTERTPVAFARLPIAGSSRHFLALVDNDGALMALPAKAKFHLPLISGLTEIQSDADRAMRVRAMQHLLADLGSSAQDVAEVNAASIAEMRVIVQVEGRGVELWLGDQHYLSRFRNFLTHYTEIAKSSGEASVFDLRIDDRILARDSRQ